MDKESQNTKTTVMGKGISMQFDNIKEIALSLYLPLEYALIESPLFHLGYTVNIFKDGLLMCVSEEIDIGQKLKVKIYYDSDAGLDYVQSFGEVIKVNKLENSEKGYIYSVRFEDPSCDLVKKIGILNEPLPIEGKGKRIKSIYKYFVK